jgi:hypothetical protein
MLGRMGPERLKHFHLASNDDLFNPAINARVALQMEREAHGFRDWSTFKSGAYRKFMPSVADMAALPKPDVVLPPPPRESARGKGDDGHVFHIHNEMTLDGAVVHRSVVKRMVRGMTHPTTAPYHDGSRHWTPPDSGLVGV